MNPRNFVSHKTTIVMKNLLFLFLFSFIGLSMNLSHASSPGTPSQKVNVGNSLPAFHSIRISGEIKVFLHPSVQCSYQAELPAHLEEYFTASVEEGILNLKLNKSISRFDMPRIDVYFSNCQSISAEGNYFLKMDETYQTARMNLDLKGDGLTNLLLDVQELKAEISGQAIVSLKGKANEVKVYAHQQSYWAASALMSNTLLVSVDGMARAEVHADKEVIAIADNSGIIQCSGKGEIRSYIHGLGTVNKSPSF
jgi:hypothetical protein